jgi:AAT family amino acid transporter
MLVQHWFMDNWPGWKMVPKTADEIAADHAALKAQIEEIKTTPQFGLGLGAGTVMGVIFFFVTVWALPLIYESITIIK